MYIFQADFADIYHIHGVATQGRGDVYVQWVITYKLAKFEGGSGVVEFYRDSGTGEDEVNRCTCILCCRIISTPPIAIES